LLACPQVADTFNHKLKLVDPKAGTVKTLAGAGKAGLKDGKGTAAQLWEPGGLAADPDGRRVWVADTNNNALRVLDVATAQVCVSASVGLWHVCAPVPVW
jgi:YVTN family beta-propeller protein